MLKLMGALVLMAATAAGAQPVEFKGVPMNASVEELRIAMLEANSFSCSGDETSGQRCRITGITYANESIAWALAHFDKGRLASVTIAIEAPQFEPVTAALKAKYGAPKIDRRAIGKNAYNASFSQREMAWYPRDGGAILATSQTEKVNEATVVLMSAEARSAAAEVGARRPAAKKDL